jgi:hypothetical protein
MEEVGLKMTNQKHIMENSEQKRRRIMGKQFFPMFMKFLNEILTIEITSEHLLSIVETDHFYSQIDYQKEADIKETMLFSDRERIKQILKKQSIDFGEKYILWIKESNDCGAVKLNSLNSINFGFPYEVSSNGVITITQVDYKYQILLDFYAIDNIEYLDLNIFFRIQKQNAFRMKPLK